MASATEELELAAQTVLASYQSHLALTRIGSIPKIGVWRDYTARGIIAPTSHRHHKRNHYPAAVGDAERSVRQAARPPGNIVADDARRSRSRREAVDCERLIFGRDSACDSFVVA